MGRGLAVQLRKCGETDKQADYEFWVPLGRGGIVLAAPSGQVGVLRIYKDTGEFDLLHPCPDEVAGEELFARAAMAAFRHWKTREFPATTWWEG